MGTTTLHRPRTDIKNPSQRRQYIWQSLILAMRFSAIFAVIGSAGAALALPTLPTAKVVPDNDYTDPNLLISQLACSNGPHGLMLEGLRFRSLYLSTLAHDLTYRDRIHEGIRAPLLPSHHRISGRVVEFAALRNVLGDRVQQPDYERPRGRLRLARLQSRLRCVPDADQGQGSTLARS